MYVKAVKVRGLKESPGDRQLRILFLYGYSKTQIFHLSSVSVLHYSMGAL